MPTAITFVADGLPSGECGKARHAVWYPPFYEFLLTLGDFRLKVEKRVATAGRENAQEETLCVGVSFISFRASHSGLDELYAKAKLEKKLIIWGGGPAANYERAARAFEQKYPGISVAVEGGASNVFNRKIEEQVKNQKVETDLIILQTIQDLIAWKKRGLLAAFKPEGFDKIPASAKDADGSWIATNQIPFFYVYNPERVEQAKVPKSATDFLSTAKRYSAPQIE